VNIGVIGMHEMPETLSNNLKKIGYNAMYFDGGFKEVLRQHSSVDVLIVIFPIGRLKSIVLAKLLGMKVVVLWIGTDCLLAQNNPYRAKIKLVSPLIDFNVADAPHLIDELRETGIEAEFIPIIPGLMKSNPLPMPEDFRVLSYIMPDRPEFYGATMIKEIANKMPEVEFFITEEGRVPDPTPNI
jgi:hypothetical protein